MCLVLEAKIQLQEHEACCFVEPLRVQGQATADGGVEWTARQGWPGDLGDHEGGCLWRWGVPRKCLAEQTRRREQARLGIWGTRLLPGRQNGRCKALLEGPRCSPGAHTDPAEGGW